MNARSTNAGDASPAARTPLIVRRGIPYGEVDESALKDIHKYTDADVGAYYQGMPAANPKGLLFMSFQASVADFETLARISSADSFFSRNAKTYDWPRPPDGKKVTQATIEPYVIPNGSAYFFAPSREFLERIKEISTRAS